MMLRSSVVPLAILATALTLSSCGGHGDAFSGTDSVSISPQISSLPVNGTQVFTATGSNNPFTLAFYFFGIGSTNVGTLSGSGNSSTYTATYTAPPKPPVYTSFVPVSQQGTVTLYVNKGLTSSVSETFTITAPAVSTGIIPATISVPRGTGVQLIGYAVGNVNNSVTWQVNGAIGGSTTNGTVTVQGLYTAPTDIPMAGPTVTITLTSVVDPTNTATCIVTIT